MKTEVGTKYTLYIQVTMTLDFRERRRMKRILRGYLVGVFKQQFSVFKQYFTHFHTFFHPHVFPQIFLNNNF